MRLVGYSCRHPDPPLRHVFLPLGRLTVLLGRNDAGKSSLLRAVERDLRGGHFAEVDDEARRLIGGVFFAEVTQSELESLVRSAEMVRRRLKDRKESHLGHRPSWALGGWPSRRDDYGDVDAEHSVTSWLDALRQNRPATSGFETVIDALQDSRLIALEPAGLVGSSRVWNVSWCLPAFSTLDSALQEALEASDLLPFSADRARREAEAAGKPFGWFTRGVYVPQYGNPTHLSVPGAPVVVAPIGQTLDAYLPRGLAVPTDFESLREEVAASVNALVTAARHARSDVRLDGDPLAAEERSRRRVPRNWVAQQGDGWQVHPDARGAVAFVAAAANRLLPRFLSAQYRIEMVLRPLEEWMGLDGQALDIRLHARRNDAIVQEFPIEKVADGMRLWVQLALLEACEQAARVEAILDVLASDWWSRTRDASEAHGREDEDADEAQADADLYEQEFDEMLLELRELDPTTKPWVSGRLAKHLAAPEHEDWTRSSAQHRRFLVVDEPERHLHPNLQREAAAWLRSTTRDRGAPCLVATHSTPFLGLPGDDDDVLYVYVSRDADETHCTPFDAGQLKNLDQIVTSLGFDRGELLTTISLFLVVEGIHDLVFLDRVFGELQASRIALLPMEGIANYQAVLESDALWRYTTAGVALTTDKFEPGLLERVVADPEEARALRRSDASEETKILAKLIGLAQMHDKTIHLLGHRGADLIDVLDQGIVQQVFPGYPGHAEAAALWRAELDGGSKAGRRKAYYEQYFGIPANLESYIRLADAHAAAGVKPAPLQAIVDEAVRISLGQAGPNSVPPTPDDGISC